MARDLVALFVMIVGTILFFYTMSISFYGSIILIVSFIVVACLIAASGEKEERIKKLEARVKELEAEKEIKRLEVRIKELEAEKEKVGK